MSFVAFEHLIDMIQYTLLFFYPRSTHIQVKKIKSCKSDTYSYLHAIVSYNNESLAAIASKTRKFLLNREVFIDQ